MANLGSGTMVTGWIWAIFSSLGTALIMFAIGMVRSGITEIKAHLSLQDKEMSALGQRVATLEGKLNVTAP